jgi:hypothetical protein
MNLKNKKESFYGCNLISWNDLLCYLIIENQVGYCVDNYLTYHLDTRIFLCHCYFNWREFVDVKISLLTWKLLLLCCIEEWKQCHDHSAVKFASELKNNKIILDSFLEEMELVV